MVVSSSLSASVPCMGVSGKGVAIVAIVVPATGSVAGVSGIVLDSSGAMGGCGAVTETSAGDSTGKGVTMSAIMRDLIFAFWVNKGCNQLLIPMRSPD